MNTPHFLSTLSVNEGPAASQGLLDLWFGKVTKIAGKGRKWSQCMEEFPVCLLRSLKALLLSNNFEASNDKLCHKNTWSCIINIILPCL